MNTQTGNWIAIAGIIVSALAHFGILVDQDSVVSIIAGFIALYGVIHQVVITKKIVSKAKLAGATGLK